MEKAKIIYEKIVVNKGLLGKTNILGRDFASIASEYGSGDAFEIFPKGKIIGIKYVPYIADSVLQEINEVEDDSVLFNRTEISIKDSRSILVTAPTSVIDFQNKSGGYLESFKKVDYDIEANEKISIEFSTMGLKLPICGEFIFAIEENCIC